MTITTENLSELRELTKKLRIEIIETTTKAGSGHPSSSFSSVEILTALFFNGILKYDSKKPDWPERDRFIMSKGHAAPLLYPILAHAGYFPHEMIYKLREINSPVQGHPILGLMPGVEATTGSLGQGLSLAIGQILGGRLTGKDFRVYVLLGDGECEAGQIWEAAMAASHFKVNELTAILDYNKYQECGPIAREMSLEPLVDKWRAFGWHVEECDGHNIQAVTDKLHACQGVENKPQILIAHTIKGKGVSFVEDDFTFHGRALTNDQAEKAKEEILCS
ncbi:MAG: transketolase [Leptolinea sp.]